MRLLLIALTVLLINACGMTIPKAKPANISIQNAIGLNSMDSENVDLISTPCAIIISPTDQKIDSMKKKDGEDFYTIADDNLFYLATARQYLDSIKTNIIQKEARGTVKFKLRDGVIVDINLAEFYWGILLFNGQEKPIKADILNFISVFDTYMKSKR